MFLLYLILCYTSILQAASYVLLAANIDDFRSLAKKLAPDHLTDEILEDRAGEHSDEDPVSPAAEDSEEPRVTQLYSGQRAHYNDYTTAEHKASSVFEMNLDDLVERVKEKLKKELSLMVTEKNTTPDEYTERDDVYTTDNYNFNEQYDYETVQPNTPKKLQARYVKQTRPTDKYKNNRDAQRNSIQNIHPTHEFETSRPDNVITRKTTPNKNRHRENTVTEAEIDQIFHGVDMVKANDSYEDYVTPKKDDDYEETDPFKYNREIETVHNVPSHSYNSKVKEREYDTINYNKKVQSNIRQAKDTADITRISPKVLPLELLTVKIREHTPELTYAEQLKVVHATTPEDYEYEPTAPTEEARTSNIDKEVQKPANPNLSNNYGKKARNPAKGTVIPKRDFYKLSSPNYLAKLPKVAEKYNFDEPIPEKDREPENLRNIGNPPASVNGKHALLQ